MRARAQSGRYAFTLANKRRDCESDEYRRERYYHKRAVVCTVKDLGLYGLYSRAGTVGYKGKKNEDQPLWRYFGIVLFEVYKHDAAEKKQKSAVSVKPAAF